MRDIAGILLAPGASAGRDHHGLVAVEEALTKRTPPIPARRIDFPHRREGKRGPDRPADAIACIREEAKDFASALGVHTDQLVLGGRSFGGRMCSTAVSEGLACAGLALLSYPLHPSGRPEILRTDHFPLLTTPILFVNGERDPFGSPAEFDRAITAIPGPVTMIRVPGAHDVRGQEYRVTQAVLRWLDT